MVGTNVAVAELDLDARDTWECECIQANMLQISESESTMMICKTSEENGPHAGILVECSRRSVHDAATAHLPIASARTIAEA